MTSAMLAIPSSGISFVTRCVCAGVGGTSSRAAGWFSTSSASMRAHIRSSVCNGKRQ